MSGFQEFVAIRSATMGSDRFRSFGAEFDRMWKGYLNRVLSQAEMATHPGAPLGWTEVGDYIFGLQPGEFAVVVGWTGLGKTWAMCQIAWHAVERGYRVYFPSLEVPLPMTELRLLSIASGVPYEGLERGRLSMAHTDLLKAGREAVEAAGDRLVIDQPPRRDRTVAEMYTRAAHHRADLVVGDQLTFITPDRGDERWLEFEEIVNSISDISKQFGIASCWAHQFVGAVGSKKNKAGADWQLAGSQHIARTADFVLRLTQSPEQALAHAMILEIIKSRRTPRKGWVLDWELGTETRLEVRREYDDDGV